MNNIPFCNANKSHEAPIFSWIDEPHVKEFWKNSKEHKEDISNFLHGRA